MKCSECWNRGVKGVGTEDEDFCDCSVGKRKWHVWLIEKYTLPERKAMVRALRNSLKDEKPNG